MPINYSSSGTAYEEAYSHKEHVDLMGQSTAGVDLRCAWGDRYTVAIALLGRIWPHDDAGQFCHAVDIRPAPNSAYTKDGQACVYQEAILSPSYSVVHLGAFKQKTDPFSSKPVYVTEQLEPATEFMKLDHRSFQWGPITSYPDTTKIQPVLENEAPTRVMRNFNLVRTIHNLPTPLDASILDLEATVNAAEYDSDLLGINFPAQTLSFGIGGLSRTVALGGDDTVTLTLKFGFRKQGWNKFWNAYKSSGPDYDTIYNRGTNVAYVNFPTGDFSKWLY